jgi:hypothetical protein
MRGFLFIKTMKSSYKNLNLTQLNLTQFIKSCSNNQFKETLFKSITILRKDRIQFIIHNLKYER